MAQFFIPVLSHFLNKNPWSGSAGRLRYRILPTVNETEDGGTLSVVVWEGPWTYELSAMEDEQTFPLSEEGLAALPAYLEQWRQTMEQRPRRTMAEDWARRVEPTKTE